MEKQTEAKKLSTLQVFLPIAFMMAMIIIGKIILNVDTSVLLLISSAFTTGLAFFLGKSWDEVFESMKGKINNSMGSFVLLILVGAMIGGMMASGTIPMLIFYGIQIISAKWLYVTGFILCCLVSLVTGTSWGTLATIGVTVMGIGTALNANPVPVAAAIIGGCWFGDKVSPLSGTNNLSAASAGVDIIDHFKQSLWSNIPAVIISVIVFSAAGMMTNLAGDISSDTVTNMLTQLSTLYSFNILLLLPIVVVLVGSFLKMPSIPIMFVTAMVAVIEAVLFQGIDLNGVGAAVFSGFKIELLPTFAGIEVIEEITTLLNRGGMMDMMSTVLLMLAALLYAGALDCSGALEGLLERISLFVKSAKSLMLASIFTCLGIAIITNNIVSSVVVGEMYKDLYERNDLDGTNLSRILQDCGAGIIALVPWSASGAYVVSMLGVETIKFFPWAVFNWIGPVIVIVMAITGFGIKRLKKETVAPAESAEEAA